MAASIVNSPRAVQMGILVVRAFVSLRVMPGSNAVLAKKITRQPIGFRSNGGTR